MTDHDNTSEERYLYHVIYEKHYHTDIGAYYSYGIEARGKSKGYILHDISENKRLVEGMVSSFNKHQLLPIHLNDAVSDIINEYYSLPKNDYY